jgi:hypothetical protein
MALRAKVTATNTSVYDSCFRVELFDGNRKIKDQTLFSGNISSLYGNIIPTNAFNMAIAQWYEKFYEKYPERRSSYNYAKARADMNTMDTLTVSNLSHTHLSNMSHVHHSVCFDDGRVSHV